MNKELSPRRALIKLATDASCMSFLMNDRCYAARLAKQPVPEPFLPGRMVMRQPPEVRAKLAELKAEDIANCGYFGPAPRRQRFVRLGRQ